MKLYRYSQLNPDGSSIDLGVMKKKSLEELQSLVGGYIEIVPQDYYAHQKWGRVTIYVNEEGRTLTDLDVENTHFKNLGDGFNIVGTAFKEEVAK